MRLSCSGLVSRYKAIRLVNHERTLMYWQIGQRIFEEEQQGKDRADYGNYLTKFIADQLEPEYGSGFSKRQIELFRQFYRTFPIANTLYSQLSWSQYKVIIRLGSPAHRWYHFSFPAHKSDKAQFPLFVSIGSCIYLRVATHREAASTSTLDSF